MEGEGAQELLFYGVVLHELRRQLHKVPQHVGARKTLEARISEHAVQRVAKLVQEGLYLA